MKIVCLLFVAAQLFAQKPVFKVDTGLVIVNVSVKDKTGSLITDLTKADFEVLEDSVPQTISVFDLQTLGTDLLPNRAATSRRRVASGNGAGGPTASSASALSLSDQDRFRNRRLIVLFFDFSTMKPAEKARTQDAAISFIKGRMASSDLISLVSFSDRVRVIKDFTDDGIALMESLRNMSVQIAPTFGTDAAGGGSGSFLSDDAEFNLFNTDRRFIALEDVAGRLAIYPEKKALVYFSSGVEKTGIENLSRLKATVNTARRSSVSVYPIDARGLIAIPPGGDASTPSQSATGILTGGQQRGVIDSLNASQETLYTLAAETGGRAFLNSNDLTVGIRQAQQDLTSYYTIGYYTTNPAEDGRYRRLKVRLKNSLRATLDYRSGYYSTKRFTPADKGSQLETALALGNLPGDLPLALEVDYFRVAANRYFVPISVKVVTSRLGPVSQRTQQTSEFDFLCQVRDSRGKLAGSVRDKITVNLVNGPTGSPGRRSLQYDTGITLRSGSYNLVFLVRHDQTGEMGTFETNFTVPDLDSDSSLKTSSVVIAAQKEPVSAAVGAATSEKVHAWHPLVTDGQKMLPSITRVFRRDQTLYVYLEVYDPRFDSVRGLGIIAELDLFTGSRTASSAGVSQIQVPRPGVAALSFAVPLANLQPGDYLAQVSVMDELGLRFVFRRNSIRLLQ